MTKIIPRDASHPPTVEDENGAYASANAGVAGVRSPGAGAAAGWGRPASSPRAAGSPRGPGGFALGANSDPDYSENGRACVYAVNRTPFVLLWSPRR